MHRCPLLCQGWWPSARSAAAPQLCTYGRGCPTQKDVVQQAGWTTADWLDFGPGIGGPSIGGPGIGGPGIGGPGIGGPGIGGPGIGGPGIGGPGIGGPGIGGLCNGGLCNGGLCNGRAGKATARRRLPAIYRMTGISCHALCRDKFFSLTPPITASRQNIRPGASLIREASGQMFFRLQSSFRARQAVIPRCTGQNLGPAAWRPTRRRQRKKHG